CVSPPFAPALQWRSRNTTIPVRRIPSPTIPKPSEPARASTTRCAPVVTARKAMEGEALLLTKASSNMAMRMARFSMSSKTAMPAMGLADDEVWKVVSYLRSMSEESEKIAGNAAVGEEVFSGKGGCVSCHMVNGYGSRFAPDLSTIGNLKADELRKIILKPGSREGYQPGFVEVRTQDGQ